VNGAVERGEDGHGWAVVAVGARVVEVDCAVTVGGLVVTLTNDVEDDDEVDVGGEALLPLLLHAASINMADTSPADTAHTA